MEKLGSGLDDDSATCDQMQTNHQECRLLSIQRCCKYLVHTYQCRDTNCKLPCQKMKRVVQHAKSCKQKTNGECPICKQLIALCCYHAKYCQVAKCPVIYCISIKNKLRQKQLQQRLAAKLNFSKQAQILKRRIATMQNRGMSGAVFQTSPGNSISSNQQSPGAQPHSSPHLPELGIGMKLSTGPPAGAVLQTSAGNSNSSNQQSPGAQPHSSSHPSELGIGMKPSTGPPAGAVLQTSPGNSNSSNQQSPGAQPHSSPHPPEPANFDGRTHTCHLPPIDEESSFWNHLKRVFEDLMCRENFDTSQPLEGGCTKFANKGAVGRANFDGRTHTYRLPPIDKVSSFWNYLKSVFEDLMCRENFDTSQPLEAGCTKFANKGAVGRDYTTTAIIPEKGPKPSEWSIDDVINHICTADSNMVDHAELLRHHEIDGKALMLLDSDMMVKYMGLKLGPALKICNLIEKLKNAKKSY